MWIVSGHDLKMAEGDYGLTLPVSISGAEFSISDTIRLTFKTAKNGETILTKEYTPVEGVINLELTEAESALFSVGSYVYCLDWYQSGNFMCNVVPVAVFKVVDKA